MTEQHTCCFTGHRPQKLHRSEDVIKADLEQAINSAIADGFTTFITGMAMGTDIWAGEIITALRTSHPGLMLIAAVPFPSFPDRWSEEWKNRYGELLDSADEIHFICPSYSPAGFQRRNEWMVDRSSRVIAVYNGEPGGTKNTIDYAKKNNVSVWYLKG